VTSTPTTPRIYLLDSRLLEDDARTDAELGRIAELGFDHLLLTPLLEPGPEGEIEAEPGLASVGDDAKGRLRGLVRRAKRHGLGLLLELSLHSMPLAAGFAARHPDWFAGPRGEAADPRVPHGLGRLRPEIAEKPEIAGILETYLGGLASAGAAGLLCRGAHLLPAVLWRSLARARRSKDFVLVAETLGALPEQVVGLDGAGFDYLLDSAAWWDFRGNWLLEQHERYRHIAPLISFPEPLDASRLAVTLEAQGRAADEIEAIYRMRWLFAATFSSGVLLPAGYELGMRERLHSPELRPGDLDHAKATAAFDLSPLIRMTNRLKAESPALHAAGPQRRVAAADSGVVGHLRLSAGTPAVADEAAVILINPDPGLSHGVDPGTAVMAAGGRVGAFADVTPGKTPEALLPGRPLTLDPLEVRIFRARAEAKKPVRRSAAQERASEKRLHELAANRVAIEKVTPELDGGRFPVKRVVGDVLHVEADIFCDGHDQIAANLLIRPAEARRFEAVPMRFIVNDRWEADYPLLENTRYVYTLEAWRDLFASWRIEVTKKHDAGLRIDLELTEGREIVAKSAAEAEGDDKAFLERLLAEIDGHKGESGELLALMLDERVRAVMARSGLRTNLSRYERELELWVDRTAAACSAWYELFPRSMSHDPKRHGTFDDVVRMLPYVREMGFDVLYFPPIHPIGRSNRKGRNNSLTPGPDDPGSPYAIGAAEGGHKAIHPELGTEEDFRRLVGAAHRHGLEIALDFAIQCSPDHPWIKQHPEWFDWRPDGTIKFAENPPKKYEDIVNVHFYRDALPAIWHEWRDTVLYWVDQGVRIFRVDNPHTKPLPFWEWMIREVNDRHPDVVFLAEAFTRPKMMKRLAKVGFQQSYSYFTWRNTKAELTTYLTELTQEECAEYMRPNFFANTPDINPVYLQTGGRAGFQVRGVLAATLSPVYGLYNGFELCEGTPVPGKEEYLDSEKYEIRAWDYDRPGNIRDYITRINHIRRDNPALWRFKNLSFLNAWNDNILYYAKMTADRSNAVLVAVNLDPHHVQACHFEVPLWEFGLPDHASIDVEDLLTGARFTWAGKIQHMWLDPAHNPCALWRLLPPGRSN